MQKERKKFKLKWHLAYILLFVLLVAIDQITKVVAFYYNWQNIVIIPAIFELHTTTLNTGSAWSFLGNWKYSNLFLSIVTSLFMLGIFLAIYFLPKEKKLLKYGLVCILAGGVGNLVDRVLLKGVRDFIAVPIGNFICNVADIAVTAGAILFVLALLFFDTDALLAFTKKKKLKDEQIDESN